MTNTPESDTMKTLLQSAKDNGAYVTMSFDDDDKLYPSEITFHTEAQLLATFNAWSAQQEGWITLTPETLPEIGERVLAVIYQYDNPENKEIVLIGVRQENLWHDDTIQANVIYAPHKWMQLPTAPLKG